MASLCSRVILRNGRSLYIIPGRAYKKLPDPMDLATGKELKELKALAAGNDDPWNSKPRRRGPGTKDEPNLIPSTHTNRIVGCLCHEDSQEIKWMWVDQGEPKRCYCGYWFKLVYKEPL